MRRWSGGLAMQVSGSAMSASGGMVARTLDGALANGGGSLERSRTTAWTVLWEILIAAGRISLGSNAVKWQWCSASLSSATAGLRLEQRRGGVCRGRFDETTGVEEEEAPCKKKLTWMLLLLLLLVWEKGVRLGGTTRPRPERGH
jgi:hypothetical protein